MLLLLSLVVLQQTTTATAPPQQIAKVEVQPSGGEVPIGGKMKFSARALDAAGQGVPGAQIGGFVGGGVGGGDSTGEFIGGEPGFCPVPPGGILSWAKGRPGFRAGLLA